MVIRHHPWHDRRGRSGRGGRLRRMWRPRSRRRLRSPTPPTAIGAVAEPLGERSDDDPDGEALDSTPATAIGAGGSPLAARIQPLPSAAGLPDHDEAPIPVSLSIPTIGVDATAIVPVGVESNGEMEVPGPRSIGWYRYGAVPGDARIDRARGPHRLRRCRRRIPPSRRCPARGSRVGGARRRNDPRRTRSSRSSSTTRPSSRSTECFARSGPESIALITCGGEFQPSLRSYEDNVVAYAVPLAD